MAVLAKIGIIGDPHLSSKNYGGHTDYPTESLEYLSKITKFTEEVGLTHLIDTGDFTYGRFDKLEYRERVESELMRQYELTNGNRYSITGNHDSATNGMTEHEYYIRRGLLKKSSNFSIGNLNITMLDYKKSGVYTDEEMNIIHSEGMHNLVIAHQYFKFTDSQIPNFGDAIILDDYGALYGADYLVCGHVHHIMGFEGTIVKEGRSHRCIVQYLGCMMRPAYREGHMDEVGNITVITIHDDGKLDYEVHSIELWPLEKAFNLQEKEIKQAKKEEKEARVDISDVVKQLDSHNRNIGNPEDIINSMEGVSEKYKQKAISLLRG